MVKNYIFESKPNAPWGRWPIGHCLLTLPVGRSQMNPELVGGTLQQLIGLNNSYNTRCSNCKYVLLMQKSTNNLYGAVTQ